MNQNRRHFLQTGALAAAGILGGNLTSFAKEAASKEPLYKISLAQWSLNRRFFNRGEEPLDNLDFAKTARGFGIDAIEYVNQMFLDKGNDQAYLAEMKKRADDNGVKSVLIMCDREGNLGEPDEAKRNQAVENHYKWADAAKFLGCHAIRVNARSDAKLSYAEQMLLSADGLRKLTEYCDKLELNCIVENHGGLSSNGKWLVGVMETVDHPRCGTLPDFGNFRIEGDTWYDRYLGVQEMMPYAKAVSAKAFDFEKGKKWTTINTKTGFETNFLRMMRIVLKAGYRGYVGIESEGPNDQMEGVRKTVALLERVREKLTPEFEKA